jgi:hypothetical protein
VSSKTSSWSPEAEGREEGESVPNLCTRFCFGSSSPPNAHGQNRYCSMQVDEREE